MPGIVGAESVSRVHLRMSCHDQTRRCYSKRVLCLAVVVALLAATAASYQLHLLRARNVPADPAFVEKLKSAKHCRSENPAQTQTVDLVKKSSLRHGALNAIGMELREV